MAETDSSGFTEKPVPPQGVSGITDESPKPKASAPAPDTDEETLPDFEQMTGLTRIAELRETGCRGANGFFIVAALSFINAITLHLGISRYFVVGLGVTRLVDGVVKGEQNLSAATLAFAVGFAFVVAITVSAFGWLARQGYVSIYALGMILYLLDGVVFLLMGDFISAGVHAGALFWLWPGFHAFREADELESALREQVAAYEPREV